MKVVLIILAVPIVLLAIGIAWFMIYKQLHPDWNPFL